MYEVKLYEANGKQYVRFEDVRVELEDREKATKFVIELLKETGRMGY
jgi:hypothetical protein